MSTIAQAPKMTVPLTEAIETPGVAAPLSQAVDTPGAAASRAGQTPDGFERGGLPRAPDHLAPASPHPAAPAASGDSVASLRARASTPRGPVRSNAQAQAGAPPGPPPSTTSAGAPGGPPKGPHRAPDDDAPGGPRSTSGLQQEVASQGALSLFDDRVSAAFPDHEVARQGDALAWKLLRDDPVDALQIDVEAGQLRLHTLDGPEPGWTIHSTSLPAPRDDGALNVQSMLQVFGARLSSLQRRVDD